MRRALYRCLAPLALCAAPLAADEYDQAFTESYASLRAQDHTIHSIGFRLLTGNAPYCADVGGLSGILLDDAARYNDAEAVRAINGIAGNIFVQIVADDSPAAQSGVLAGQEVVSINGKASDLGTIDPHMPWLVAQQLNDAIGQSSDEQPGAVVLAIAGRTEPLAIPLSPACRAVIETVGGYSSASTDGLRVAIGRDFTGFSYPEEELAAALAHELAHVFLGHPDWLAERGRKRSDIRQTEREADRLMPWLLANAGYDPAAAARFMRRWGPDNNGGVRLWRKHDGWDERLALIEAELPRVSASRATHGSADWKADFVLQIARD